MLDASVNTPLMDYLSAWAGEKGWTSNIAYGALEIYNFSIIVVNHFSMNGLVDWGHSFRTNKTNSFIGRHEQVVALSLAVVEIVLTFGGSLVKNAAKVGGGLIKGLTATRTAARGFVASIRMSGSAMIFAAQTFGRSVIQGTVGVFKSLTIEQVMLSVTRAAENVRHVTVQVFKTVFSLENSQSVAAKVASAISSPVVHASKAFRAARTSIGLRLSMIAANITIKSDLYRALAWTFSPLVKTAQVAKGAFKAVREAVKAVGTAWKSSEMAYQAGKLTGKALKAAGTVVGTSVQVAMSAIAAVGSALAAPFQLVVPALVGSVRFVGLVLAAPFRAIASGFRTVRELGISGIVQRAASAIQNTAKTMSEGLTAGYQASVATKAAYIGYSAGAAMLTDETFFDQLATDRNGNVYVERKGTFDVKKMLGYAGTVFIAVTLAGGTISQLGIRASLREGVGELVKGFVTRENLGLIANEAVKGGLSYSGISVGVHIAESLVEGQSVTLFDVMAENGKTLKHKGIFTVASEGFVSGALFIGGIKGAGLLVQAGQRMAAANVMMQVAQKYLQFAGSRRLASGASADLFSSTMGASMIYDLFANDGAMLKSLDKKINKGDLSGAAREVSLSAARGAIVAYVVTYAFSKNGSELIKGGLNKLRDYGVESGLTRTAIEQAALWPLVTLGFTPALSVVDALIVMAQTGHWEGMKIQVIDANGRAVKEVAFFDAAGLREFRSQLIHSPLEGFKTGTIVSLFGGAQEAIHQGVAGEFVGITAKLSRGNVAAQLRGTLLSRAHTRIRETTIGRLMSDFIINSTGNFTMGLKIGALNKALQNVGFSEKTQGALSWVLLFMLPSFRRYSLREMKMIEGFAKLEKAIRVDKELTPEASKVQRKELLDKVMGNLETLRTNGVQEGALAIAKTNRAFEKKTDQEDDTKLAFSE